MLNLLPLPPVAGPFWRARSVMNCPTSAMPDRWALMTLTLAGAPIPVLPPIRGRQHRLPCDSGPDRCAAAWELLHGPAPAPLPPPRPRWATLGADWPPP